jgi:hypothetical protein
MADDKEHARQTGEALMVCKYPDVCKSPTVPVPYMIVANFRDSQQLATTVNATSEHTFTKESYILGVIGDEGGAGGGVCSGTHAGGGACWASDWAHNVRAEGQHVVRNGDPTLMNGQPNKAAPNTQGTVVYTKGTAPKGGVDKDGKPTADTNPGMRMRVTQYGYSDDPYMDSNTLKGLGIQNRRLEPGVSMALTRSAAKALGVKPGDWVKIEYKGKGGTQIRRYDDRAPQADQRVDLYNPSGFVKGVDDYATITRIPNP